MEALLKYGLFPSNTPLVTLILVSCMLSGTWEEREEKQGNGRDGRGEEKVGEERREEQK